MKILGAILELPAKQHCQSSPLTSKLGQIGQIGSAVQLVCSSKTAPRILIFSIAMGAKYLSYVKSIATSTLTFFGYIILVLACVHVIILYIPNQVRLYSRCVSYIYALQYIQQKRGGGSFLNLVVKKEIGILSCDHWIFSLACTNQLCIALPYRPPPLQFSAVPTALPLAGSRVKLSVQITLLT